ncbi:MAG TPA: serine hydrolase [Puia sp.]|nr:serine hydrolase [Puia sp.]
MLKTFTLSCILFTTIAGLSQDLPPIVVKGVVINYSTGEPVSYATITLAGRSISTVTNEEGRFIFKFHGNDKKDSLRVACVGYIPVTIPIHLSDTGLRSIRLKLSYILLKDVTVKAVNALELIRKAIARIPDNYSTAPYVYHTFYRLTGRKQKSVVHVSEAVLQVYNNDYSRAKKQFKVIRAREDKDLPAFGGMEGVDVGAKPEGLMDDDIVGSAGETGLLSKEGLNDHVFTYKGIVDYNGQDAYVIQYDIKDGVKKALNKGTVYLDVNSLAFLELQTKKSPKGMKYWSFPLGQRMVLKLVGLQARLVSDTGVVKYRKYGSKYYLSHVYGAGDWYIASGRRHFELNPLRTRFNYLVTDIDTTDVTAFKKEETYRVSTRIENSAPDKNTDSTDAFWGDYNLIQADYNVDSAAKIIRANNETLNYKEALSRLLQKYKKSPEEKIDSILSFYYHKGQFNGTALVKYKGKVIYSKGFGWADDGKQMLNTAQTQFVIGSTSKQFTAMLIMQLINEGRLSVDDTAGKYLPGFRNGRVTIGQLLTHQSGIPNYLGDQATVTDALTHKYTTEGLLERFCSDSLEFEPGTRMEYSNSGFVVLAAIVEKLTGKRYADVLAERIFIPLGMTHSYFGKEGRDTSMLAKGYINDTPELDYPIENELGAGGITSTAQDLLLWHDALSANTLLPKEKMDELFKPRVQWDEWGAWYGYGWMIDRLQFDAAKKHTIQYHPGTEIGFYDMLVRQPDKDIFIILLNNHGDFPRFDMTDLILNELN